MITGSDAPDDILHLVERNAWARGFNEALRLMRTPPSNLPVDRTINYGRRVVDWKPPT